jgi:NOL1/NOP2/sun family putative RNA methylase
MKIELYEIYRDIYAKPTREASELALEHGYLPYMVQRYLDILGEKGALELIRAFEKPVKPVVRTNTLIVESSELKIRLENLGFKLEEIPWAPGSFWVTEKPKSPTLGATHEYLKGYYYVHRDASGLLPVLLLLHEYSGDVLDTCAAPGGKATYMAQILRKSGSGVVYANDLVLYRLKALIGHAMRMRLDNIIVLWSDARTLNKRLKKRFHRILLDAPCSGEGRISVDPTRKHKTSILDLAILIKREIELLASLVDLLEPGGVLAYVTCSIAPEENEYVVNYVTRARRDLVVIDPPTRLLDYSKGVVEYRNLKFNEDLEKCIRLWPHIHGLFGYTICLLSRRE